MLAGDGPAGSILCKPKGAEKNNRSIAGRARIVYFHGGGYVFGSPVTHRRLGEGLASASGLPVLLPDTPLAPEHPWPAPLDAALARCERVDGPLILSGDSAGRHLALVTALALARRGVPAVGLTLFSPNNDRSGLSDTREANDPLDPVVDNADDRARRRWRWWRTSSTPTVSPRSWRRSARPG